LVPENVAAATLDDAFCEEIAMQSIGSMSNPIESRLISRLILVSIDFGLFLQPQRLGERRAVARGRYFTALKARPFDLELAGTCARLPVIRTPSMVCHGEDNDPFRFHPVDERKWKPLSP
jgi:hypothetical protein